MLVLSYAKQPLNPSPQGLQSRLDSKQHLILSNATNPSPAQCLSYQNYLFDYTSILSHLTYLFTQSPLLVRSMLRHKDGKTFKYIVRNLYFLLTMNIDDQDIEAAPIGQKSTEPEYRVWFDLYSVQLMHRHKIEVVREFFKRSMLDNPHLTSFERRAKLDARILF